MKNTTHIHKSRPFLLALVVAAIFGAHAKAASATTYCVHKDPCPSGGVVQPTIDAALDTAAANNNGADTVLVGANGGQPYIETLNYVDDEPVHLLGDGAGQTVIAPNGPALVGVRVMGSGSVIENLTVRVRDADSVTGLAFEGMAREIEVRHEGTPNMNLSGVTPGSGARIEDSSISVDGFTGIRVFADTEFTLLDASVRSGGTGIAANAEATDLTVRRSTVRSGRSSIKVGQLASAAVLENTVLRSAAGFAAGDGALDVLNGASVDASHLTIVGNGVGAGVTVSADSADTWLDLNDSVIAGYPSSIRCFGENGWVSSLFVKYSSWTAPTQLEPAGECTASITAHTAHEPRFVGGLTDNLRLRHDSELIDAADPASPSTLDREGLPRPIDGDGSGTLRADIGAYEYQRQAPVAKLTAPPSVVVGAPATFGAGGTSDPDPGDELTLAWDFGDGASATGSGVQHAYGLAGVYTVTLTATDPTGKSATATAQIEVTEAPVPPAPAPETTIADGPSRKQLRKRRARFSFTASDPAATFECRLDDAPFAPCSSPTSLRRLKRGRHVFAVRAVGAGGTDPSPAERRFRIRRPKRH